MDLVAAAVFLTVSEADVACSALRSAGIDATVAGNVGPYVARANAQLPQLQLLVPEDQLADARAILAEFEPATPTTPAATTTDSLVNLARS
jgi:hypothetical protein